MNLKAPSSKGWFIAVATGLLAVVLPLLMTLEHHGGFWEAIPGWWGAFGFVGCSIIILFSKWLGKIALQKPEAWYDR